MTTPAALFPYALSLADDALVLGHRLSQWSSRAPTLEEDIALSNLALDLIGQARLFYALANDIEGKGRGEDGLAYFRGPDEFRNVLMVERPNGDFAHTIVRQLLYSSFAHPYFEALCRSKHDGFAEIAAKAAKEMAYHVRHAAEWVIRLGDGTEESHRRAASALVELWPYTGELFEADAVEHGLVVAGIAVDRPGLRPLWETNVGRVLQEAGLDRPPSNVAAKSGGRMGRHTPCLGEMLDDMQVLARAHPGATW